jgi:hypothetical protein
MLFAHNFNGFKTHVGNVLIYVTEHSIGETCHLPVEGERWWKKNQLPAGSCNQFLVLENHDPDWSQGIPSKWFKGIMTECFGNSQEVYNL